MVFLGCLYGNEGRATRQRQGPLPELPTRLRTVAAARQPVSHSPLCFLQQCVRLRDDTFAHPLRLRVGRRVFDVEGCGGGEQACVVAMARCASPRAGPPSLLLRRDPAGLDSCRLAPGKRHISLQPAFRRFAVARVIGGFCLKDRWMKLCASYIQRNNQALGYFDWKLNMCFVVESWNQP